MQALVMLQSLQSYLESSAWFGYLVSILAIVAMWRIFSKAGHAGWLSLIPVANAYVLVKIAWGKATAFFIGLLLGLAATVLFVVGFAGQIDTSMALTLMVLAFVALLALLVISLITQAKLAGAFGRGAGFACGLIFLPTIFMLILAFDSSKFIGRRARR